MVSVSASVSPADIHIQGGINIPTQMPVDWVHRSQKHIVVTINYRVNIVSYPNACGLNGSTNFRHPRSARSSRVGVQEHRSVWRGLVEA